MFEGLSTLASECGSMSTLLSLCVVAEIVVIKLLWNKIADQEEEIKQMYKTVLEVVSGNTEVITKLIDRIDHTNDNK